MKTRTANYAATDRKGLIFKYEVTAKSTEPEGTFRVDIVDMNRQGREGGHEQEHFPVTAADEEEALAIGIARLDAHHAGLTRVPDPANDVTS